MAEKADDDEGVSNLKNKDYESRLSLIADAYDADQGEEDVGEPDDKDDDAPAQDDEPDADGAEDSGSDDDAGEEDADKDDGDEADPDKDAAADDDPAPDKTGDDDGDGDDEPITPPQSWSNDDVEAFNALPPDVKTIVLRRESERDSHLNKVSQEAAEDRRLREQFNSTLEPVRQTAKLRGMDDMQMVQSLIAAHTSLEKTPDQAILWLMQNYGGNPQSILTELIDRGLVDVSKLQQTDDESDDDFADPALKALEQRLDQRFDTIEQTQASTATNLQQRDVAAQQVEDQNMAGVMGAFSSATDEQGKLRYPHFETLRGRMRTFVENGDAVASVAARDKVPVESVSDIERVLAESYSLAYQTAPETRDEFSKTQRLQFEAEGKESSQAQARKREAEKKRKAKEAEKSSGGVRSAGSAESAGGGDSKSKDLRGMIGDAWEATESSSRV